MDEPFDQNPTRRTAVYGLTPRGAALAGRLARALRGTLYLPEALAHRYDARPFRGLLPTVARSFHRYDRHVFVAAAGIVVRAVAPHIRAKDRDPAVVVLDTEGRFAVSLLSGHLGGANDLAREAAGITGGTPVITTATDTAGVTAWDLLAAECGLAIADLGAVKALNLASLNGDTVFVADSEDRLGLTDPAEGQAGSVLRVNADALPEDAPSVAVTWKAVPPPGPNRLVLHPRCLVAGVGCNRGTASREILDLLDRVLLEHGLARASLSALATIEAKRDEAGILEAAGALGVPLTFYSAGDLRGLPVPNPSSTVRHHMGVESVCEAAAMRRAGADRLLVPKVRSRNATLAMALESSSS